MDIIELIARYIWPLVLGWNIYLFGRIHAQEKAHAECRLFCARNYTSKTDLERMFNGFEKRFDEKFSMVVKLVEK
ncbi:MAG: hypothetical protein WBB23_06975 [Desulforhopalus sp.]